ncbi:MAG TPA: pyridoxine 5'-phosphate synthase [Pyrinomonadaceae bacterium]|nr:pyridoxine 5'-phosphate synthase [Pyrinomonadaceae bacterium]
MTARLNVNIDHVATVRQARRAPEPSVIAAAMACEQAGVDGITVHLRGDRRHIQDLDIRLLRDSISTYLNLEMAATDEMLDIALQTEPDAVTLVAERPNEITTEGGLNAKANIAVVSGAVDRLREANILTSLFIDPDPEQIEVAQRIGAQQVELCTAAYAEATLGARGIHGEGAAQATRELQRLKEGAELALKYGLNVAAGHGLTYRNVGAVARMSEITEFNIGHNIVARAIFVGLENAVREMRAAISHR